MTFAEDSKKEHTTPKVSPRRPLVSPRKTEKIETSPQVTGRKQWNRTTERVSKSITAGFYARQKANIEKESPNRENLLAKSPKKKVAMVTEQNDNSFGLFDM